MPSAPALRYSSFDGLLAPSLLPPRRRLFITYHSPLRSPKSAFGIAHFESRWCPSSLQYFSLGCVIAEVVSRTSFRLGSIKKAGTRW